MDFKKRYTKLNTEQKKAVDQIDGPVMVIAGPGTGKTELLGVRAANILKITDTSPENILCLTYTDSGVNAMRQRLIGIIGADAHKVGIYTFHSFCADIINQNPEYFYNGASYKLADKITINEILNDIFTKLPYDDVMASINNGQFTQIKTVQNAISDIKKSGLKPDELDKILDANNESISIIEKIIAPVFEKTMSPKIISEIEPLISKINKVPFNCDISNIISLGTALSNSLQVALTQAKETNKAKSLSDWKSSFTEKDGSGNRILKSRKHQIKLRSINKIYQQYLDKMDKLQLYDYDEMILQAVHKIKENNDLKLNLQEKYQYIMVDEFQDTNMAQMQILQSLTDNEVNADMPNIMIVGDDEQAIYSFQGANISNILDFTKTYPQAKIINLIENYRSNDHILSSSRKVITQSTERLENTIESVNKKLNANHSVGDGVSIYEATNIADEHNWIAKNIRQRLDQNEKPSEIAIIARGHQQITDILPYLYYYKIPVNYEKSNNALDQEPIIFIEKLADIILDLSKNNHIQANSKLPEILSHPAWKIKPSDLWQLSLDAYKNKNQWMQQMQINEIFAPIFDWLIQSAALVPHTGLENILDIIIGIKKPSESSIVSPLYQYYFDYINQENDPEKYITYLESLRSIRKCVIEYHPNEKPNLETFTKIIQAYRQINETIQIKQDFNLSEKAVNLMTAHSSKGLEFESVYIINATNELWNKNKSGRFKNSYPENLQIGIAGDSYDEKTRLFFVAMTRAKHQLHICYSLKNNKSKETSISAFLTDSNIPIQKIVESETIDERTKLAEIMWYQSLVNPITITMFDILHPNLINYKLSPTALNNFIDLENSGPEKFLINNLLHFPQAKNSFTIYGNAIHETLNYAHKQFLINKSKPDVNDLIEFFEKNIAQEHLDIDELKKYIDKGTNSLTKYFSEKNSLFNDNQKTEEDFKNEGCIIENALIAGKIDLIDIDKPNKTIIVTDYKTGKQFNNWITGDCKVKAHKYRQQLMFYKLLIETSAKYRGYKADEGIIKFVEPDKSDNIINISMNFDQSEINEFIKLINAVYKKIINLDLPDTSNYSKDISGIKQFEQDLINNVI